MDHFGIGVAIAGAVQTYFLAARRSGRTTSLVESVKNGDRVVFADQREKERVEHLFKDRGVNVECIVIDPRAPGRLFERGTPEGEGRTIFDHTWVERYYMQVIDGAREDIDRWERESSGWGEPHRETRRRAQAMQQWNFPDIRGKR